ncbi:DMT family transporter [Alkalihalobacillus trypoxylicola]|uniref:EamA domain-containing protein n=1 Tax=Alkalihalobacillus trypoxylicola TaxID=519424 RepID=A0A162E7A5_9BACI|nr:DMT family transporter [Alkalihalobacillus trypoxylicola]KYG31949.1 hypothetical protein AZF04_04020 [Alkalihalobacillus trypoxylicola]
MKKGISLNVASVMIMSLTPLLNKFSLDYFHPLYAALLNCLFAGLFCFIYALIKKEKVIWIMNKKIWMIGLTNAVGLVCLFISLDYLSPVTVGFLGRFYTIFAIILAVLILKEKLKRLDMILILIAILGTFLFVEKGATMDSYLGIAVAIFYTFFFALTNTLVKISLKEVSANMLLFYNNMISILFIFLFMSVTGNLSYISFNVNGMLFIFIGALLSGFLGLILFYEALRYIHFSLANLIRATGPILVAIYSYWFFPVELTFLNILGAVLLLCSIVLISMKPKQLYKKRKASV